MIEKLELIKKEIELLELQIQYIKKSIESLLNNSKKEDKEKKDNNDLYDKNDLYLYEKLRENILKGIRENISKVTEKEKDAVEISISNGISNVSSNIF